jgi:RimJ/RimL family protein N-acetyltransferase
MRNSDTPLSDRPLLKSARLLLRQPDTADIGAIMTIAGDWEVASRLSRVPHPYREDDAHFFLETVVPNEWVWAITWLASGELVGMIGLSPEPGRDTAELGYYVARRSWAMGIATEAARPVVAYAIETLGLPRLTSGHPRHPPSPPA